MGKKSRKSASEERVREYTDDTTQSEMNEHGEILSEENNPNEEENESVATQLNTGLHAVRSSLLRALNSRETLSKDDLKILENLETKKVKLKSAIQALMFINSTKPTCGYKAAISTTGILPLSTKPLIAYIEALSEYDQNPDAQRVVALVRNKYNTRDGLPGDIELESMMSTEGMDSE